MARVPYNPVPDIQPQSPSEGISVNTPPAAFGENIGNALSHLGSTVGEVGNELFSRAIAIQDLSNQTEARNKVIDFTTQAAQKQADFDSLQGIDAKNALPQHLKDISDLRNSMRGTLGSPMAQRYFDQEASSFQNRVTFSSAAHAGDQFKSYAIGTAQANIDNTTKAYVDPFSESERDAKDKTIDDESHTIAALKGWSDAERQSYVLKSQSVNRLGQIEQQAMKDPIKAYGTLQTAIKNGEIDQASGDRALDRIYLQNRGVGVQNQAASIYSPGKSLAQMDAEAHEKAQDQNISLGDPMFEKDLKTAVRSKEFYDKSITRDQNNTNMTTVMDALHSDKYHTLQEMLADPDVGTAIHSLPSKDADKIPEMINQHWIKHDADQQSATFTQLYGLAQHNPAKFLDMNLYDKDLPLARADRGVLLQMRKELTKNPDANPQVQRALSWMAKTHGQELSDLGVRWAPSRSADPQSDQVKNYNMFVGELAQSVESFQQTFNHPPTSQEFEEKIAKPLLQTQSTSHGTWFHGFAGNRNVPEFEKEIPDNIMTEAKGAIQEEALKNNLGADYQPSENEIRMYIVRKQWDDFYKKSKGDGGTGQQ